MGGQYRGMVASMCGSRASDTIWAEKHEIPATLLVGTEDNQADLLANFLVTGSKVCSSVFILTKLMLHLEKCSYASTLCVISLIFMWPTYLVGYSARFDKAWYL